jgi:hypothetical protein
MGMPELKTSELTPFAASAMFFPLGDLAVSSQMKTNICHRRSGL